MEQILQLIKSRERILVASHAEPDGDCLGSLVALGLALNKLDKTITLFNSSPIPAVYRFLPGVEGIVRQIKEAEEYDLAIVLDCGDIARVGEDSSVVEQIPIVVNIDHHVSNTGFGDLQLIDTDACATAEIIYRLIKALEIPFDKAIATAIYLGILTDTGSFRFSNTNPAAFAISKSMIDIGVEPYTVAQRVFGTYSLGRIKLLNLALNSIEISENGKLSLMTISRSMLNSTGTSTEDIDGLINYARRIEDVKVAALIHEIKNGAGKFTNMNRYHVSLRSDSSVDVAKIANKFGGGGHTSAAGFQIESTLVALKEKIIQLADNL
ncbi:MAG: bifunctional oligoribonuclease/PAP phosphatase NrnA [Deltaproteobacteria bacterium]|jgi:phosphoesterase RecJ-like protein|nr:bifunctional oligoribonuclease/PAP phosphatase NrnA [Deltaproteobacteria bacterium]